MSDSTSKSTSFPVLLPLPGKVFLRRTDPADLTPSPYIMPDAAKTPSTECVVVAVPSLPLIEWGQEIFCPVRPGQRVLVGRYAGDYDFRHEKVTIVKWDEILAIIPDPEEKKENV